jgi:hypothetical protein
VLVLQLNRVLSYFIAVFESFTLLDVIESEHLFVSIVPVSHSKVNQSAIAGGSEHSIHHHTGEIYFLMSWQGFFLDHVLIVAVSSVDILTLLLVE